jgi:hypothetical protein
VTTAGIVGAAGIRAFGGHDLGLVGAALVIVALIVSKFANRRILAPNLPTPSAAAAAGLCRVTDINPARLGALAARD